MRTIVATKWWLTTLLLLLLTALPVGLVYAQAGGGSLTVDACNDLDADGICGPGDPLPAGVEACLDDGSACQPVPAVFDSLAAGSYTPFLRFTGASQGYYPTTARSPVEVVEGQTVEVTLGAVYPFHPKGVAVHPGLNKVYVAFQGPMVASTVPTGTMVVVVSDTALSKPYPFGAVIDSETDQVLQTIPGGPEGIGLEPWGVAVSGDYVYVGSFGEGRVSVIDANSDTVIASLKPDRSDFQPTSPYVNPINGWVHFPDFQGGRITMIDGTNIVADAVIADQCGFNPFELVVADALDGFKFATMRGAVVENEFDPTPYKIRGLNSAEPFGIEDLAFIAPGASDRPRPSGPPHAIGLWEEDGMSEPRFFVTYASDPRTVSDPPDYINPDKLAVYSFFDSDPKNILLRNSGVEVGPYAEVGLVNNPLANHMLGTYAGFPYFDGMGDAVACDNPDRGGVYAVDFDGNLLEGEAPGRWKLPSRVAGSPALEESGLLWKNPFELAVNPNNNKVYVTDRCWNDYPEGGQAGGGAVLIFVDTVTEPGEPTPTPTGEPTITPTTTPTATTTPEPGVVSLVPTGPATVAPGEVFSVTVEAQNVDGTGLYGFQFDLNYDPALISVSNVQVDPAFSFVVINQVDNTTGQMQVVASRQGNVTGLTGNVPLVTFDATAVGASGTAEFSLSNAKLGNPQAQALDVTTLVYTVVIEPETTPTPTGEPTGEPTEEPTPTPTGEPTGEPTEEPTPTPTGEPTGEPTEEPTPTPTGEPTGEPTEEPTPTPTGEPTTEPTPTPTSEPGTATVTGQVILAGRAGNDWSGALVTVDDSSQNATTDSSGNFSITSVITGVHSSITADAPGYMAAICTSPAISAPTTTLAAASLLSGDVNDDNVVDVADATAVGMSFGLTGPDLAADINRDGIVDIFDIILASVNFGVTGPTAWDCINE